MQLGIQNQRVMVCMQPLGLKRSLCYALRCQVKGKHAPEQANSDGSLLSMSMDGLIAKSPRAERARKYFRTVYDFPQWEKHRSQYRFVNRLLQIGQSHILQNVAPAVSWVVFVSAAVAAYMTAHASGVLPKGLPPISPNASSTAFIQNTTVALSLLLVFRTNSSYGRWDEARKMWGGLLNRSRDIMRQGATCFPDDSVESKKALARWVVAFSRALRIHFQPEVTLESELSNILTPEELKYLAAAQHKPDHAIHAISQVIQSVPMSPIHQQQMSSNLTFMHDVLGGCERLLRAPIPVSYTRLTARFIFPGLTLLPFALYSTCGWAVVPVCGGIAMVLCGIEEIGVQAEEPFGILPLDVICNRIQADVMATLQDDEETKTILKEIWVADMAASKAVSDAAASSKAASKAAIDAASSSAASTAISNTANISKAASKATRDAVSNGKASSEAESSSNGNSHEISSGNSHEVSIGSSHKISNDSSLESSIGNSHEISNGNTHKISIGNSHEISNGNSHEISTGNRHEISNGNSHEIKNGNSKAVAVPSWAINNGSAQQPSPADSAEPASSRPRQTVNTLVAGSRVTVDDLVAWLRDNNYNN